MISTIDILIIGILILILFLYFFVGGYRAIEEQKKFDQEKKEKEKEIMKSKIYINPDSQSYEDEDKNNNRKISIYESDKYKDKYEELPWEELYVDDEVCPEKIMDGSMIFETNNLRRRKFTIY